MTFLFGALRRPHYRRRGLKAVMAFNDLAGIRLVHGLQALGLRVPEDVSVTGFDDIPFARFLTPALTTAAVPYELLGDEAWGRTRALLHHEIPGRDAVLRPGLEVRGSTAAPRGSSSPVAETGPTPPGGAQSE